MTCKRKFVFAKCANDSLLDFTIFRKCDFCVFDIRNLNCIHIELIEIKKALEKAVIPAEKYRSELIEANIKLHERAWCIIEQDPKVEMKTVSTSLTDLLNSFEPLSDAYSTPTNNEIDVDLLECIQNSIKDQRKQTKSIIEDNINLRIR